MNKKFLRIISYFVKKILRVTGYFVEALKYMVLYPIAMVFYRHRHIYIFAERGTDARDNGYYLYRFYRQHYPDKETYYIISKKSADRQKVMELGHVVNHGSFKHYLLFIASEYMISTHIMGYSPNVNFYSRFAERLPLKGKRIFLQHGITSNDLPGLYSKKTKLDIFICGAKPEFDYVVEKFGYQHNEVKYTGLARYDGLHERQLKNRILCMPTWRAYLLYGYSASIEESDYVTKWNSLLNDKRLIEALNEKDLELVFYPHYDMQKYLSLFETSSQRVIIADRNHYDVQQLLKESQLLVTDYSSVFYDFAYMQKPVVYYQFDQEQYYKGHYKKGYFDYDTMGFGEVVKHADHAVEVILSYINRQFAMDNEYKKRIERFFPLYDTQNCQRIFDEIEKL